MFDIIFAVGDQKAAKNIRFLKRYGITHVLNAAEGPWEEHCVNLSEDHYVGSGITYLVTYKLKISHSELNSEKRCNLEKPHFFASKG